MKDQKLILFYLVLFLFFLVTGQSCVAETKLIIPADHYKPAFEFALRAPAVPISDFYDTDDGKMQNFKARSVVGGFYMKMLFKKLNK